MWAEYGAQWAITCYNNCMKILYVITTTCVGGAEQAMAQLAQYMKEHQAEVRVLSLHTPGAVANQLIKKGFQVDTLDMQSIPTPGQVWKLRQIIKTFQPDIVHAMLYSAIELCRLVRYTCKFTLVTTPHFDMSRQPYMLQALDRTLKSLDKISFAESLSTAQYLIGHQKYLKSKVYLLPNSIDRKRFARNFEKRQMVRTKWGVSLRETVFICVARLSPEKNHITLLKAFKQMLSKHPQARLVLVGDGPERENIELFVSSNDLTGKVILEGQRQDVSAFLSGADVFVLSSNVESLPLSLLESMAAGLPALVTNVGDIPRFVEHGQSGFICKPGDNTLLCCVMTELAVNEPLRKKMGERALQIAEQKLIDNNKAYQKAYEKLVG